MPSRVDRTAGICDQQGVPDGRPALAASFCRELEEQN
jgi:hypothetical protein